MAPEEAIGNGGQRKFRDASWYHAFSPNFMKTLDNGCYPFESRPAKSFLLQTLPGRLQRHQGMHVLNGNIMHCGIPIFLIVLRSARMWRGFADEAGNSPQRTRRQYLRRVKPVIATHWFFNFAQTAPWNSALAQ